MGAGPPKTTMSRRHRRARLLVHSLGYTHRPELGVGLACPYCSRTMTATAGKKNPTSTDVTRDHVIPRCQGGRSVLVVCCDCNYEKGDLGPLEWLAYLILMGRWSRAQRALGIYRSMRIFGMPLTLDAIEIPEVVDAPDFVDDWGNIKPEPVRETG